MAAATGPAQTVLLPPARERKLLPAGCEQLTELARVGAGPPWPPATRLRPSPAAAPRRASLLLQADDPESAITPGEVDAQLSTLVMPPPDVTQCCAALLGQAGACLELMQIAGLEVQHCAASGTAAEGPGGLGGRGERGRGRGRAGRGGQHEAGLSPEAAQARCRTAAGECEASYARGRWLVEQTLGLAGQRSARRTQVGSAPWG